MSTNIQTESLVLSGIKKVIEEEANRVIDDMADEIVGKVRAKIGEISARVSSSLTMYSQNEELIIKIDLKEFNK